MTSFLHNVAKHLLEKYGQDLAHVAVVFPNKRAALFLNQSLAQLSDGPIWSPSYITISDLFREHSGLTVADPILTIAELYKSYTSITGSDEPFEQFYPWGQLLLSDFDDLDKNLADAKMVFRNLRDYREYDDVEFLTEEQKALLKRFFNHFTDNNSQLQQRFLDLWSRLYDIYTDFRQRLRNQSLAYEGMLYRDVACRDDIKYEYDHYVFVGFNMVHPVEQQLFRSLQKQGKGAFYWDFDHYYMQQHEAGHYISQYLADFPNELDIHDDAIYRQFQHPKQISYISAPTENIQAHYVSSWLREHQRYTDGRRTAILLCDEKLLPVVIHNIPPEVDKANITTGYPLYQTPAGNLVNLLINLQIGGYRPRLVNALRRHPYAKYITDEMLQSCHPSGLFTTDSVLQWILQLLQHIAQQAHQNDGDDSLRDEALFRTYTLVNRLLSLVNSGDLTVDLTTLQRLINQLIQSTSIPFHGEPAEGIQIMGILESRNLDFDHVLLLSCNEGNMPKGVNDSSFIPYSLRKAYGLTTIDHKTAIYSYYFHRILQRASDITFVYNNATEGGHTGEMSRFMLQLMVEGGHPIRQFSLKAGQLTLLRKAVAIEKTPAVMQLLKNRFAKHPDTRRALLTPTAINAYRRCQLNFFYRYGCGLREPDKEDVQIDDRIFGIVFHAASQYLYQQLMQQSQIIEKAQLKQVLDSKVAIEMAVDRAFHEQISNKEYSGLQLINREVIIHYVRQLLQLDLQLAPFTILNLEYEVFQDFTIHQGNNTWQTTVGGTIDRLDSVAYDQQERIRVIDYKTGGGKLKTLPGVESIFSTSDAHNAYYLQTLLYSSIVRNDRRLNDDALPVSPALLFIQHSAEEDYDPTLFFGHDRIIDVQPYISQFDELLHACVDEMFNPDIPFQPASDPMSCRNCPFLQLCGKV